MNVGSGGGAAAAPAAGGAAAGGAAAAEETKEEEKEEGMIYCIIRKHSECFTDIFYSQGGVRRGYGFRSLRLSALLQFSCLYFKCMATVFSVQHLAGQWSSSFP